MQPSLWVASTPQTDHPPLDGEVTVDVAVLGAGITGLTAATLLKEAGKTVAVVESKRIAEGVSGYTTAKLTSGHGLIYARLRSSFGPETARAYAASNEAGLARIAAFIEERGLECDFERTENYVYSERPEDVSQLRDEAEAARAAGLDASFITDTPLPYPVAGAVRLEGQAQFHPRKYLLPLAAAIPGEGSHLFEWTRAFGVRDGLVRTDRGLVHARDVVVATHLPFLDRGLYFAKAHPAMSYAVAAQAETALEGMYISSSAPRRSIRTAPDGVGRVLIVGGEGHKPGVEEDTRRPYASLECFLSERFGLENVRYRWSAHDYVPVDDLPYIGQLTRRSGHVHVATGFAKWGLTKGTLAAMMITDAILGRANPWAELYDASRIDPRRSAKAFARENLAVGARFVGDRLRPGERHPDELGSNEGAVIRSGTRRLAVSRDEDGELHILSARCTHLGCIVRWNTAEHTWDCPCHGSRFTAEGRVTEGPATADLEQAEL